MSINNDLLYEVLLEATAFPEVHEQKSWARATQGCGTSYCMAGLALAFNGQYDFEWDKRLEIAAETRQRNIEHAGSNTDWADYLKALEITTTEDSARYRGTNRARNVEYAARKELGLTPTQADELFAGFNSIGDLWKIAERFTNGAVTMPSQSVIDEYRLMGSRIKKMDADFFPQATGD